MEGEINFRMSICSPPSCAGGRLQAGKGVRGEAVDVDVGALPFMPFMIACSREECQRGSDSTR